VDLEKIKKLMSAMEEHGVQRIAIKEESGFELELEKSVCPLVKSSQTSATHTHPCLHKEEDSQEVSTKVVDSEEGFIITSPMVGTFYSSPAPGEEPFIKIGDHVDAETVLCVIEAMKVMNEVKAGKKGTIAQIFVDHAHPVEFGTKLFRIV